MRKNLKKALITSVVMLSLLVLAVVFLPKTKKGIDDVSKLDLLTDTVDEQQINEGGSRHLSIGKNEKILQFQNSNVKEIYNVKKSEAIKRKIDVLKKRNHYSFENPLLIWNPFGTNELSLYYYFKDEESTYIQYTIQVENKNIPDFTRILNSHTEGNLTRNHEYLLTGFIPGYKNYVVIRKYNRKGKLIKKDYFDFYVNKLATPVKTRISYNDGRSTATISEGLYCVCGYHAGDRKAPKEIPFYDNSGILRSVIPIQNYRTDRIEVIDGAMIYSYSNRAFAKVSRLGQVEKIYDLGNYRLHHDFVYNDYGQLWCLATNKKSNSINDSVISVNLSNGTVTKLVDFGQLFPKVKKQAERAVKTKRLNWIDLNSICRVDSSDIIVSSRELSSIIRINHITSGYPKLGYLISDSAIWKKTNNKKNLLLKGAYLDGKWYNLSGDTKELEEGVHNFSSHLGQNSVTCEQGVGLSEGQYYLTLLDNNYAYSTTLPKVNWSKFIGAGTKGKAGNNSFYYEYLIDEKAGYYGLKRSYPLPYTANGGNVYWNGTNTVANTMEKSVFGEYDKTGKLIREYALKAYRIFKYNMKNIWYY